MTFTSVLFQMRSEIFASYCGGSTSSTMILRTLFQPVNASERRYPLHCPTFKATDTLPAGIFPQYPTTVDERRIFHVEAWYTSVSIGRGDLHSLLSKVMYQRLQALAPPFVLITPWNVTRRCVDALFLMKPHS